MSLRLVLNRVFAETRQSFGLTQQEFANRLSCSRSLVAEIEAGDRRVTMDTLQALIDGLGISRNLIPEMIKSLAFAVKVEELGLKYAASERLQIEVEQGIRQLENLPEDFESIVSQPQTIVKFGSRCGFALQSPAEILEGIRFRCNIAVRRLCSGDLSDIVDLVESICEDANQSAFNLECRMDAVVAFFVILEYARPKLKDSPMLSECFNKHEVEMFLCFLALRVELLNDLAHRMLAGGRFTDTDIRLYLDPPLTPQMSIVSSLRPIKKGCVDFRNLSRKAKEAGLSFSMKTLKSDHWLDKSEGAFGLGQLPFIVPQDKRALVAQTLVAQIHLSACPRNFWYEWHCGTKPYVFVDSLDEKSLDRLRQCSEEHPEIISRMGAKLSFPIKGVCVFEEFVEIIHSIFTSKDPVKGCEYIGAYGIFELCNVANRIYQEVGKPVPLPPLKSAFRVIMEKDAWPTAQSLIPHVIESISLCLEKCELNKLNEFKEAYEHKALNSPCEM